MGSPLSPILAELVMETLLRTVTKKLDFPIPVLKKYVDDLILALPQEQIENTLRIFNEYNPHLQFTVEKEEQGRLPFLDTLVIRNPDQTISTQWYSKPISSGRLLNYHSFHPTSMKINIAANFIKRVTSLTNNQTYEQQCNTIFQHLRQNNYPSSLINRMICRARSATNTAQHQQHQQISSQHPPINNPPATVPSDDTPVAANQQHQIIQQHQTNIPSALTPSDETPTAANQQHHLQYRSIPYIAHLSPTIASLLRNDYPQVKVAYRTLQNTKNILRPVKDRVDVLDQCNVIYSLACINCQNTYIGMTRNKLKTRISGHRSNMNQYTNLTQNQNNNTNIDVEISRLKEKTAMMKHVIEESHLFNLTQPKILDKTNKTSTLPILEMCHIAHAVNTVNHRTDVQGLSTTYAGLLHTIKKSTTRRNNTNSELPSDRILNDQLAHDNYNNPP